ncbi:hypothetical protein SODALDRAFT_331722 [Sodiomyces alkalinus F11]|uniref:DUF4440 domain-containing protein n=1 Tax=Sodiomyces alkalinus (strain CBS 110278 / VKM F-3762 / F11) TaxID=1314773 RepID=A0A3N2PYP8_SODAK|nr:hypothetical protein SODALDRAFT_331722 [Sodiomyces alkalinus F11]ROT39612.1 hypothetical protein SODALDRAFT_331722 [Sodiomyces alkalinus F11]
MGGTRNIFSRNRDDTIEAVTLLWRAFCDPNPKKSLKKYLAKDAILVQPDGSIYSPDSDPSLDDFLEDFEPWTAYRMDQDQDDLKFVEVDMMSSSLTYHVTAWKQDGEAKDRMRPTEAICTSIWRQGPGGDWVCCLHHMAPV